MQRINSDFDLEFWEQQLSKKAAQTDLGLDPAHDLGHFHRVASVAKVLAFQEKARLEIVIPAAWLHDLINIPKNDPRRALGSTQSGLAALNFLEEIGYPSHFFREIEHAIRAHSFSARIEPQTLEAKIVQDADRLDAIGAIGIARCFSVGGLLQRPLYCNSDPFSKNRTPDDTKYTIDHFFIKLFKLPDSLQTSSGKKEGEKRISIMKQFLQQLGLEINLGHG
jgi:uncharacterized protein